MKLPDIKITDYFKKLFKPSLPIGGLELSHSSLKLLIIENNSLIQASLRIPVGIIEKGKVKNYKLLVQALENIHKQVTPLNKNISVILTLPSSIIYTRSFDVPVIKDGDNLKESIHLNLTMVSPNELDNSYYDWQLINQDEERNELNLIGAFTEKGVVDKYEKALKEANFNVVAVEFPSISLTRLIQQRWVGIDEKKRYLLIDVNNEGVLLLILKNGNLFFSHFNSWKEILEDESTEMEFSHMKSFFINEVQRVLNFYLGKTGDSIEEVVLISPIFKSEITEAVDKEFSLKIRSLQIKELPNLGQNWFSVLGSALRGLLPRYKDDQISLTARRAQVGYFQERLIHFIDIWRDIVISALLIGLIALTVTATLVLRQEKLIDTKVNSEFTLADLNNTSEIKNSVTEFNKTLVFIDQAISLENYRSDILELIIETAGERIKLARVFLNTTNSVAITASTDSDVEAINFKNRLEAVDSFTDVRLPLSNINTDTTGRVNFSLSFNLVSED